MSSQAGEHVDTVRQHEKLALFLDIDGILHRASLSLEYQTKSFIKAEQRRNDIVSGKKRPEDFALLDEDKQEMLAEILERNPHVVLVISSAWRNWGDVPNGDLEILSWLKAFVHPTLANRIVGKTSSLSSFTESVAEVTRLDEIRDFMRNSARSLLLSQAWVAIDDQVRHFPSNEIQPFYHENGTASRNAIQNKEFVVLVNGEKGLTAVSAQALEAAIDQGSAVESRLVQELA